MATKEVLSAYLVLVRVNLLGGKEIVAVDAFRAEDADTALNYARNFFLQSGGEAVVYGRASFFAGTIGGIETENLGVLDEGHKDNAHWVESMDVFDKFLDDEERRAQLNQRHGEK